MDACLVAKQHALKIAEARQKIIIVAVDAMVVVADALVALVNVMVHVVAAVIAHLHRINNMVNSNSIL